MSDIKRTYIADDVENKVVVKKSYDAEPVLEQNKIDRKEFTTYKARQLKNGMVKVASLHPGDVERLISMGYNILSPDPEEVKRAVLFIQAEQQGLLTVDGKPFAKVNKKWQ